MEKNKRVLIVGCPEKRRNEITALAMNCGFIPTHVPGVDVGIRMLRNAQVAGENYDKVISLSHTYEEYEGKKEIRLGSEIAAECGRTKTRCIVFNEITGTGSIIQEFLLAAKRAGAVVLKKMNWEMALCCFSQ